MAARKNKPDQKSHAKPVYRCRWCNTPVVKGVIFCKDSECEQLAEMAELTDELRDKKYDC